MQEITGMIYCILLLFRDRIERRFDYSDHTPLTRAWFCCFWFIISVLMCSCGGGGGG